MRESVSSFRKLDRGFILGLVIVAALFVAALLSILVLQDQRRNTVQTRSNIQSDFVELKNRMKNIFEIPHLCTCNLRNLAVTNVSGSLVSLVDPSSTDPRRKFGYYELNSDGSCAQPVDALGDTDIVLQIAEYVRELRNSENKFKGNYLRIDGFQMLQDLGELRRYSALLKFGVESNQDFISPAKSNMADPTELTVFLELESVGSGYMIKQCYQPGTIAVRSPSSPPSSQESSCADANLQCRVRFPISWNLGKSSGQLLCTSNQETGEIVICNQQSESFQTDRSNCSLSDNRGFMRSVLCYGNATFKCNNGNLEIDPAATCEFGIRP